MAGANGLLLANIERRKLGSVRLSFPKCWGGFFIQKANALECIAENIVKISHYTWRHIRIRIQGQQFSGFDIHPGTAILVHE